MKKFIALILVVLLIGTAHASEVRVENTNIGILGVSAAYPHGKTAHWVQITTESQSTCGRDFWIDLADTALFATILSKKMTGEKINLIASNDFGDRFTTGVAGIRCRLVTVWLW